MFLVSKSFGILGLYGIFVMQLSMLDKSQTITEARPNDANDQGGKDYLIAMSGGHGDKNKTRNCDGEDCFVSAIGTSFSGWVVVIIIVAIIIGLLVFLKLILAVRNCLSFGILPSICQECIDKCLEG